MSMQDINSEEELLYPQLKEHVQLHADQLIIEVIKIMLQHEQYSLSFNFNGKSIIINFKELIEFLADKEYLCGLLLHKLNFTLESAILTIVRIKSKKE